MLALARQGAPDGHFNGYLILLLYIVYGAIT